MVNMLHLIALVAALYDSTFLFSNHLDFDVNNVAAEIAEPPTPTRPRPGTDHYL